jgi:hypothetical protein
MPSSIPKLSPNLGTLLWENAGLVPTCVHTLLPEIKVGPMIGQNRQLVTNEPVEVHQDCRKIIDHFRVMYRIYLNLIKENRRMSTCNRLDAVCMFDKFLLTINFKSKVSRDVLKNKKECQSTSTFSFRMSFQNSEILIDVWIYFS